MGDQSEPDYMTTAEVAKLTRKPSETLRYYRHKGIGPRSFRLGRTVLYERADVLAWIKEAQSGGAA